MTLLRKYPPMENCYYRVKLKNGRTIGPFRSGEWSLEPPEAGGGNPVPFLRFAHPVRPKGNIGLTPNEIDEVIVVCPRAIEVPDVELLELPEIDLSNNPSWGWIESRTFDPPR